MHGMKKTLQLDNSLHIMNEVLENCCALNPGTDSIDELECREDFFRDELFNNACVPICPTWRQDPVPISTLIDVVVFISYGTGLVTAIVIIVISLIRYKIM